MPLIRAPLMLYYTSINNLPHSEYCEVIHFPKKTVNWDQFLRDYSYFPSMKEPLFFAVFCVEDESWTLTLSHLVASANEVQSLPLVRDRATFHLK